MQKKIYKITILLFLAPALCHAVTVDFYTDGTINSGDSYDVANVWDTATVEMYGGLVGQLKNHNSGTINFYAGTVTSITLQNTSIFNLEGNLTCNGFRLSHSSIFNINAGVFDGSIRGSGNQININAGTISISESYTTNYTVTNIYGGVVTFEDILFDRQAVLNIYRGDVTFIRDIFGDAFRLGLWASINVYYSDIIYGAGNEIIGYYLQDNSEFMLDQFTQSEIDQINFFVPGPATLLDILARDIINLKLQQRIENRLLAKLDTALQKLADDNENNDATAINSLEAFINAVEAQSGKKISKEDADNLIAAAQEIIELLSDG